MSREVFAHRSGYWHVVWRPVKSPTGTAVPTPYQEWVDESHVLLSRCEVDDAGLRHGTYRLFYADGMTHCVAAYDHGRIVSAQVYNRHGYPCNHNNHQDHHARHHHHQGLA